ncbi:ABC transporter permease [Sphaerimonospora thailandensis]|uniref:Nitrate ABC transporter permease n=1 Tax=Sphaerimonospora thailandensis TaxID=795644 RepID=A0A8J3R400_9ACTN|nr:ABC transporter permease [Sphaerimonospora thailandensis]GIH68003.1 nitrate ABC transporter permease [Sphaerimonospora thailandensis]
MRLLRGLARLWVVPVALAAWEVLTRLAQAPYFPPPSTIAARSHELWFSGPAARLFLSDEAVRHLLPSLWRLVVGWAGACLAGVLVGIAVGRSRRLAEYVNPLIHFGRSIPPPTLLPIFLVLFGVGTPTQLAAIVFGVLWPVLLNSVDGARDVDRQYLETADVFRLSRGQRLWRIILPAAAPKVFAGLRLSVSLALVMMIISELVGSTEGIGYRMLQDALDIPAMWTAIVLIGVLGFVLNAAFVRAERWLLAWHYGARKST